MQQIYSLFYVSMQPRFREFPVELTNKFLFLFLFFFVFADMTSIIVEYNTYCMNCSYYSSNEQKVLQAVFEKMSKQTL